MNHIFSLVLIWISVAACARADLEVKTNGDGSRLVNIAGYACEVPEGLRGSILAPVKQSDPLRFIVEPDWGLDRDSSSSALSERGYFTFFPEQDAVPMNGDLKYRFESIPTKTDQFGAIEGTLIDFRVKNMDLCQAGRENDIGRLELVWRTDLSRGHVRCSSLDFLSEPPFTITCEGSGVRKGLKINFGSRIDVSENCSDRLFSLVTSVERRLELGSSVNCSALGVTE